MLPKSLMAVLCASVAMILVGCAGERFSANDQWWLGLIAARHHPNKAHYCVLDHRPNRQSDQVNQAIV